MARYDVTDEAVLRAAPQAVFDAVVAEMDGKTSWWRRHHRGDLREGSSFWEVGAVMDMTVMAAHGRWPIRFVTKTVEVVEGESIRVAYCGGALRGEGTWRFEATDGAARVSYRWRTSPAGGLRLLAPFLPVAKSHSDSMTIGFARLRELLEGVSVE